MKNQPTQFHITHLLSSLLVQSKVLRPRNVMKVALTLLLIVAVTLGQQTGKTTRYWDCCKPSCSWSGKAPVNKPVKSCAKNGITALGVNDKNGCESGGTAYACNDNQPWAVNDNLSYGFAAAHIAFQGEWQSCCGCYELTFTSGPVAGKKFVAQVTNTGGDLGDNHFDLMIPGGGVGIFNGCASQWNAPAKGWGDQYGGVKTLADCDKLPTQIRDGCKWRFGWFKNADNPTVSFKEVTCPAAIIQKSGCQRTG